MKTITFLLSLFFISNMLGAFDYEKASAEWKKKLESYKDDKSAVADRYRRAYSKIVGQDYAKSYNKREVLKSLLILNAKEEYLRLKNEWGKDNRNYNVNATWTCGERNFSANNVTLFHSIAQDGQYEVVERMLECGENPNIRTDSGETTLHMATSAYFIRKNIIELLIAGGADVNAVNDRGETPLYMLCVGSGSDVALECAKLFVEKGVNPLDGGDLAPVFIAAECGREKILSFFLERGIDINLKNSKGDSLLCIAVKNGRVDAALMLMEQGAKKCDSMLEDALSSGKAVMVKKLIEKGYKLEDIDKIERFAEKPEIFKLLKDNNYDIVIPEERQYELICEAMKKYRQKDFESFFKNGFNPNAKDKNGFTPLHYAIEAEDIYTKDISRELIKNGADVNIKDTKGMSLLHKAVIQKNKSVSELVTLLIENKADINAIYEGKTPFEVYFSASDFNLEVVKIFVEAGADIKRKGSDEELFLKALMKGYDVTEYLIEKGAYSDKWISIEKIAKSINCMDPNAHKIFKFFFEKLDRSIISMEGSNNTTPLFNSITYGNQALCRFLIENGVDVNKSDNRGRFPLYYAVMRKNVKMIRILLESGADVNAIAGDRTALDAAIYDSNDKNNNIEIIKILFEAGADLKKGSRELRPLMHVLKNENVELAKFLVAKGAYPDKSIRDEDLLEAATYHRKSADTMKFIVELAGKEIIVKSNSMKNPVLFAAAERNNYELCKYLLENGADVNAKYHIGKTPAFHQAVLRDMKMIQLFIENDVDLNVKDEYGRNALSYTLNDIEKFKYLIEKGAQLESGDDYKDTILILTNAARNGNLDAIKIILENNVNKDDILKKTVRLLHLALEKNTDEKKYLDVVKYLVETLKFDVNGQNNSGCTPLCWAASGSRNIEKIKYLIEHGAEVVKKDKHSNNNPLVHAAETAGIDIVTYLIEKGADINAVDSIIRKTPLDAAFANNNIDVVKLLLAKGADIKKMIVSPQKLIFDSITKYNPVKNVTMILEMFGNDFLKNPDPKIENPLYTAVMRTNIEILKLLLEHGADPNILIDNVSLLKHAVNRGNIEIVKLLLEHKAVIEEKDQKGKSILDYVAGNLRMLELLIANGVDINLKGERGSTWLMKNISNLNEKELEILDAKYKPDFNIVDEFEENVLTRVAESRNQTLLKYLIEKKKMPLDYVMKGKKGIMELTLLDRACGAGATANVEYLLGKGLKPHGSNWINTISRAIYGNIPHEIILRLIEAGGDLEFKDGSYGTPLEVAVRKENFDMMAYLLERKINTPDPMATAIIAGKGGSIRFLTEAGYDIPQEIDGTHIFAYAVNNERILSLLIEKKVKLKSNNNKKDRTFIEMALGAGNLNALKYLISCGADVNEVMRNGYLPLAYAAAQRNGDSLQILIDAGADVNGISNDKPILFYVFDIDILKRLIKAGADVNARNSNNDTLLHNNLNHYNIDNVKFIINAGADVNAANKDGQTPLFRCANNFEVAKLLVDAGADVNKVDRYGRTPLFSCYNEKAAMFLINSGADMMKRDNDNVLATTNLMGTSIAILKEMEKAGFDINKLDKHGNSLLHNYAYADVEILKYLLKKGLDLNLRAMSGMTALAIACRHGKIENVKLLLEAGANPDDGVALANSIYNIEITKLLLDLDVNPNKTYEKHPNAITSALINTNIDVLKLLVERGANVASIDHTNLRNLNMDIVQFLKKNNYDMTIPDSNGMIILSKFFRGDIYDRTERYVEILDILIEAMKDKLDIADQHGRTPFMYCAERDFGSLNDKKIIFMNKLIAAGADINLQDANGETVLFNLVGRGRNSKTFSSDFADILAKNKVDLTLKNSQGFTLLDYAAMYNIEAYIILIKNGSKFTEEHFKTIIQNVYYHFSQPVMVEFLRTIEPEMWKKIMEDHRLKTTILTALLSREEFAYLIPVVKSARQLTAEENKLPLLYAIHNKNEQYIPKLIELMKIEIKDDDFELLVWACKSQSPDMVKLMVEKYKIKTFVENDDTGRLLPMHSAAESGNLEILSYIYEKGGKGNLESKNGSNGTPLDFALRNGNIDIAKFLISKGAKCVDEKDMLLNFKRMQFAIDNNKIEILELLVENGANLFLKGSDDESLLYLSIYRGNDKILRYLLDKGLDPNEVDKNQKTLFDHAIYRSENSFKMLAEAPGMRFNLDKYLCIAAQYGRQDIIKYLLELGIDPDYTDENGKKAYDYVPKINDLYYNNIRELLRSKMKNPPPEEKIEDINPQPVFNNMRMMDICF